VRRNTAEMIQTQQKATSVKPDGFRYPYWKAETGTPKIITPLR